MNVVEWLLDSDPSIRWQVMRDLTHEPDAVVAAERSSFNTTICVLEGLLEYEKAKGAASAVRDARLRGQEYLLERKLFRSLSTGEVTDRDRKSGLDWREFAFPTRWHYDVLWGLDYLRKAGAGPDERAAEAVNLVAGKQHQDGRWPLDELHAGKVHFNMEGGRGTASRWITLRALRVLMWYQQAQVPGAA